MKLAKLLYKCENCGHETSKWQGKCLECDSWNSLSAVETITSPDAYGVNLLKPASYTHLSQAADEYGDQKAIRMGISEIDRILSGGLLKGSVTLLGGEPGIGKSTLLLQIAASAEKNTKVMYLSAEEAVSQVAMRAVRLNLTAADITLVHATTVTEIFACAREVSPDIMIIDSIQTVADPTLPAATGSVTQVRAVAELLVKFAKEKQTAVIMAGHVTKDGTLAGPKVLEHLVDTVISFEGDRHHELRILTVLKHRFGPAGEVAILAMTGEGLKEVADPSQIMLADRCIDTSGSMAVPVLEGQRCLLVELQALAVKTSMANPKRQVQGVATSRLGIVLGILEQRIGCTFSNRDVFVSVAGGLKVAEPALDLALSLCLVSAFYDIAIDNQLLACGEVGLGGEIRQVTGMDKRLIEAARMGFKRVIVPSTTSLDSIPASVSLDLEIIKVPTLRQAIKALSIK